MINQSNIQEAIERATDLVLKLRAQGLSAYIVGGLLRTYVHGGETSDIDIAICDKRNFDVVQHTLKKVIPDLELKHNQEDCTGSIYNNTSINLFTADWRIGDVNIIQYNSYSIMEVIWTFDFNFNRYYSAGLFIDSPTPLRKFEVSLNLHASHNNERTVNERYPRFRAMFPDFDWSNVDECITALRG